MFWNRNRDFFPMAMEGNHLDFVNRFFNGMLRTESDADFPAFNVWADAESAVVTGALPGVKMDDLEITASGKTITVKGGRKDGEGDSRRYLKRERRNEAFNRAIELPFRIDADKVSATLTNGMLQIILPRSESDKPRKIAVHVG